MNDKELIEKLKEIIETLKNGDRDKAEDDLADLYDELFDNDIYDDEEDDNEEDEDEDYDDDDDDYYDDEEFEDEE